MTQSGDKPSNAAGSLTLGHEISSDFARRRGAEGTRWAEGYTQSELDTAQRKYGLVFPPDLVDLFLKRRPVQGWDWRSDDREIREMLERPYEGLLFDVENSGLWWPEWGIRPEGTAERKAILRKVVDEAPKLIPLLSHRYIPSEPNETGNPIFSIVQSDVIYYGTDLADYFEREFVNNQKPLITHIKPIRFWSDLVERAHQAPYYLLG
jgi:hypothetical protein